MSDETLISHCSPTLADLKCANLFNAAFTTREEMIRQLRFYNKELSPNGLVLIPLRYQKGRALLYLFRPEKLQAELNNAYAGRILRSCGYENTDRCQCLKRLKQRLAVGDDFPHEIGLFLSYPPEDVDGFIQEKASHFKASGIWKVYGDVDKANRTFLRYKRCREVYENCYQAGIPLTRLAVKSHSRQA